MKITKNVIRQFESEQKDFGTYVAVYNIVFLVATELLKDLGIKKVKTIGDWRCFDKREMLKKK